MRWPPSTGETNTECSAVSSKMVRVPDPNLIEALDRLNGWFGSELTARLDHLTNALLSLARDVHAMRERLRHLPPRARLRPCPAPRGRPRVDTLTE